MTIGDVVKQDGEDGPGLAKETVLTFLSDQCCENCCDYIFEVNHPKSHLKTSETKIVEMLVEMGSFGSYGT